MTQNKIAHRIRTSGEGLGKSLRNVGTRAPTEGRAGGHGNFDWLEHNPRSVFKR